ncbi:MAG: methyltetrahydrofolate cobalamin methyltransferase [Coriobacteriales bacterium]|jgi:5-methyltetrahydrofolate--homocysteine methyltransferase|nr:methyltetrahydrofolate cobalamin methyltransferase [Coriobacteriales bacterium]
MIIIGEKINGTIPSTGVAIASRDSAFIADLAVRQSEAGADFIDVCASTAPEVEVEALKWLIDIVQSVTDVPISIDSPNPHAIKAVFTDIEKPGLINSVSLEADKTEVLFPLIADTEWQVVALLCDNNGIPQTSEQRLEIARQTIDCAVGYGIAPSRLHIDPLVISLSTDQTSMTKFIHCCQEIKSWYPEIHITSGLSNISFGLPLRKSINQSFLVLAMGAGMDSAIMDPLDRDMLATLLGTDALLENDRYCRKYTTAYRQGKIGKSKN